MIFCNSEFLSCNSVKKLKIAKLRIARYKRWIAKKKRSELWYRPTNWVLTFFSQFQVHISQLLLSFLRLFSHNCEFSFRHFLRVYISQFWDKKSELLDKKSIFIFSSRCGNKLPYKHDTVHYTCTVSSFRTVFIVFIGQLTQKFHFAGNVIWSPEAYCSHLNTFPIS